MRALLVVVAIFYTLTLFQAHAQVNFSPAWGKRSADMLVAGGDPQDPTEFRRVVSTEGCQTPLDCLLRMQRLLKNRKSLPSVECETLVNLCSGGGK